MFGIGPVELLLVVVIGLPLLLVMVAVVVLLTVRSRGTTGPAPRHVARDPRGSAERNASRGH